MISIVWHIEQLSCYPQEEGQTDVVFSAAWRVSGELTQDGVTYYGSSFGSQVLSPYSPKSPFVPYSDLVESQVIGWVQSAMGEAEVAAINAGVEQQIQGQITPAVVSLPLPWVA
mgnify:CR=1 FL=1